MPFVLDASVAAAWAFNDEDHPTARTALERLREDVAVAPGIWRYEICNVLLSNERRGRLGAGASSQFISHLRRLPIIVEDQFSDEHLMEAARSHSLTAYDAAYLELALRRDAPLATLDRRLADAARAAGGHLL